ncbi:M14 family metallopeptidase [Anaerotalea alkaliphila]|uniref:Succinylglutamate desuccinylase n=1 Tax=Anaerotalea alkaliphila TaxID=2662126 RepID=A0A7X5HX61_9FIRM|nr:M14 family metallopeptidase [Anaerotalea alkaliphila]NDL68250.1 succinylglutamate desuccinylase [Anaerotalea alkaliphila]
MVENVVSIGLFVDERMEIKKNRFVGTEGTGKAKRICIATGIHGDELEGQYVCWELARRIRADISRLKGIVDIYPALNPLGIDAGTRGIPMFDLDMNRIFPGSEDGAVAEHVAAKIIADMEGADLCVDIHSSSPHMRELPQVRLSQATAKQLLPHARLLHMDLVWIHASASTSHATLSHSLNQRGVPTLVVEMGGGMRITRSYGDQLVDGLFHLMAEQGIWGCPVPPFPDPVIATDSHVRKVRADVPGLFLPVAGHNTRLKAGEPLGKIVDALTGEVVSTLSSPCDGLLFTLREYPVVYPGSLLARILGGEGR